MIETNEELFSMIDKVISDRLERKECSYDIVLIREYLLTKNIKDREESKERWGLQIMFI